MSGLFDDDKVFPLAQEAVFNTRGLQARTASVVKNVMTWVM